MARDPDRSALPWDALVFVLAAGGVALAFTAIGWWFATRRQQAGQVGRVSLAGLTGRSSGALQESRTDLLGSGLLDSWSPATEDARALLSVTEKARTAIDARPLRPLGVQDSTPRASMESFTVGSTRTRILDRSIVGPRHVRISTSQPLRVALTGEIQSNPSLGLAIYPSEQPFDMGVLAAEQSLFAIVPTGGLTASVTVWSRGA